MEIVRREETDRCSETIGIKQMEGREMETQSRKCGTAGTERNKEIGNEKRRNICRESWVQYEDEYGKRKREKEEYQATN